VTRGELYRVYKATATDPKRSRVLVVVSRQVLIASRFSTVVCAPVYPSSEGLSTQVPVGVDEGLKHDSAIHCDELVSILKNALTDYVGALSCVKLRLLDAALRVAVGLEWPTRVGFATGVQGAETKAWRPEGATYSVQDVQDRGCYLAATPSQIARREYRGP